MDTRTKGWREAERNRDGAMGGIGMKFCSAFPSLSDDLKRLTRVRRKCHQDEEFPLPSLPLNEYYTSLRVKPSYAISRNTTI